MKVKVDEDLPRIVAHILREQGHDTDSVLDEGLGGASDEILWRYVQAEGRFLVTADKGFADIRSYPPGAHGGVLLLRPDQDGIPATVALLDHVLATYDIERLRGAIAIASPRGIRIRHS